MKRFRVNISVYFAVIIACIVVLDSTGLAVLALLCAVLHEAGHFVAIRLCRAPVEEVSFKVFGVGIKLAHDTKISYRQEFYIALAGCTSNMIFAIIALLFYKAGVWANRMQALYFMNLCLCAFNLLPIGPLDGGRALEAALCARLHYTAAHHIVSAVSAVFVVPLTFLGVYLLAQTGYNFSLLLAAAYLAASLVLKGRLLEFS
jgi:stage IV sporulation protein FB